MRVFLRNFPEINRDKFLNEESYENAVKKQNKLIYEYKLRLKKIVTILVGMLAVALIALIIFGSVKLIQKLTFNEPEFSVSDTVLSTRNVKLKSVKIYDNDNIVVSEPFTVCIDPGHGGEEYGETLEDADGEIIRSEKYDNMTLGLLLQEKLEEFGVNVIMTRTGDTKHSNNERCTIANENNVDLFVSLHRNNEKNDITKKGVEIYTPTKRKDSSDISYQTGENILKYLNASGISLNGGTHVGSITSEIHDFQVNRDTNMASVLIEMGYISNEEDNVLYDLNIERYATAIAYGILKSFAPECIEFNTDPTGEIIKNNLIFDYENLSTDEITYSIDTDGSDDFSNYLYNINQYDELYGSSSAEFIKQNDKNEVYLSFDVGNDAGNVKNILNILYKTGVKAVFFVNYTFAVNHPDLIKDIIEGGHIVGNGTADFPSEGLTSLDEKVQLEQIIKLHEYVLYNYNYCMSLFRFPNGIFSEKLLAIVNNYQYTSVFWSYSYNDYTKLGFESNEILESMDNALNSGIIYTLRTDSDSDLDILESFINNTYKKGFSFGESTIGE